MLVQQEPYGEIIDTLALSISIAIDPEPLTRGRSHCPPKQTKSQTYDPITKVLVGTFTCD